MSDAKLVWDEIQLYPGQLGAAARGISIRPIALLASAWLLCVLTVLIRSETLRAIEEAMLLGLHRYANAALDWLAQGVCASVTAISVGVLLYLCCRKQWKDALFWLSAVGGGAIVGNIVKRSVERYRPDLWDAVVSRHNFGFPSGHATHSMALLIAALILLGPSSWRRPLALCGMLYVVVVGVCRLYLGLHVPTDVLGGWLLALAWVCGISLLFEFVQRNELRRSLRSAP
jgi:undecaprenyl-diphosphatase